MLDTVPTRPIVRYHGGKWLLAPWIISHFPEHRIYVEPFCGGASVLLQKPRTYSECINDLSGEMVNVFRVLRDPEGAEVLKRSLLLTPFARDEYRAARITSEADVERARQTIIKSFMGFGSAAINQNTGFRSNSNRSGTTPAHDWANYPSCVPAFVERLRGVVIENKDACELMIQHDQPTALHYVDPPYPKATRDAGNDYCHEMTDDDHRKLAEVLHGLNGMVILSGYRCDLYDKELFADWYSVERKHLADGARERIEVLWMNAAAAKQQVRQEALFG